MLPLISFCTSDRVVTALIFEIIVSITENEVIGGW